MNRKIGAVALILALALLLQPTAPAHAGSPFDDPSYQPTQGGGSGQDVMTQAIPSLPTGYTELPISQNGSALRPALRPFTQQDDPPPNPNDPLYWLSQVYNTGTWLVNAALAPLAAALLSVTGVLETVARWGFGLGLDADNPGVPSGTLNIESIVLGTPELYTTQWQQISHAPFGTTKDVYYLIQHVVYALLGIVVMGRGIVLYGQAGERRTWWRFAIVSIAGVLLAKYAWSICDLMVQLANRVGDSVINRYAFWDGNELLPVAITQPEQLIPLLSLSGAIALLAYWATAIWLVFQAIKRIVLVNLFIITSPLAGLAVATDGGWSYGAVWFFRLLELLLTPLLDF